MYVAIKNKFGFVEAGSSKKTLVNSLIGFNHKNEYDCELKKLNSIISLEDKPDIISDLSTIRVNTTETIWYKVANETQCVSATLPIYLVKTKNNKIDDNELLEIIIEQMEYGVGLITIHPTANKEIFNFSRKRLVPITSRGGGMVVKDLISNEFKDVNVYLRLLPKIIHYAQKYGVTLSIGTTFRSGNIFDTNDEAQNKEIELQITLAKLISQQNVGVIIEAPGHARPCDIKIISAILRSTGFPIMPLGPIPTETAVGMDHISGAIGATIMGLENCADILATVTREEHTGGRPTMEATIEAVKVAKVAAHIIDIHKIDDTAADMKITKSRVKSHSCVSGKITKYCDRCQELCPLMIR
jgi:phosphomethylpyrimidine synthase